MWKHLCGVAPESCSGAGDPWGEKGGTAKLHNTAGEAFDCYARYLVDNGHKRIGAREFVDPTGSFIRVLTKRSRFGCPVRSGKRGEGGSINSWCRGVRTIGHHMGPVVVSK